MSRYLTRRNILAAIIFVILALGSSTEYIRFTNPNIYWATYAVTICATIVLTILWLFADSKQLNVKPPSNVAYFATILVIPLGVIVHLFQTRSIKQALIATIMCVLFAFMAVLVGDEIGWQLFSLVKTPR